MNYYKVAKTPANFTPLSLIQSNPKRYFILRDGDSAYHMNNIIIDSNKQLLTCMLDTLPIEHRLHLNRGSNSKMRYTQKEGEIAVLNEVHIYVEPDGAAMARKDYSVPLNNIMNVEVLKKDNNRTAVSHLWGGIAIVVGTAAAAMAIIAASGGLSFGE